MREPVSRREVLKYALAAPAVVGLGALAATAPGAAAQDITLIDYAEALIRPAEIKAAGYAGVVQYVAEERPGANFPAKPLTRQYADALQAEGLQIVSNYQYGKPGWPTPSDYTRGYDGGVSDAKTALLIHTAAGGPTSAPIFFSVDEDIDADIWQTTAREWFRGLNSVMGVARTGIYGHARACGWAIDDGVVGASTSPGHFWAWQTPAWSYGNRESRAVLYQFRVNTASTPGPPLGGINVSLDEVMAPDYGQWSLAR